MSGVNFYVYIITNKNHTVLYTGFTSDLERRMFEHKTGVYKEFSFKYNCNELLYYEEFIDKEEALHRERQLKKYKREWKENLICGFNPSWRDLYDDFLLD
ncbi:GIY-YIG nuclease family protein [Reichenbachiella sp.]|uniref:GIY-YIG nuclease family protein n=1 Tax=Reichenbachiella sp. TaxID=2184521 RepID=UPI003BB11E23